MTVFVEDCDDYDEENVYGEVIKESLNFEGDLNEKQLKRLHQVAKACSIRGLLENGIQVQTEEE